MREASRADVIRGALEKTNWDLLACSMPSNVLLISGYWPAAGYSLACATRDGRVVLIVPEDESEIAEKSWADEVLTYTPAPLDRVATIEEAVFDAFMHLKRTADMRVDRIGFELSESFEPAAYAPHLFRGSAVRLLRRAFPSGRLAPADELLAQLRSVKTSEELQSIRWACRIAEKAFLMGLRGVQEGRTEAEVAADFRRPLSSCLADYETVKRCDGFVYCMSGTNSCIAFGPYARSRIRRLAGSDLVIVRCHSYAGGYWAEIARTYHLGPLDDQKRAMFDAVFSARDAVLEAICPGISGSELDGVARRLIESRGFGAAFKHAAGHGAGFGALEYTARPRLHPKSTDIVEPGMIIKLDMGVYVECGGIRNCDIVFVGESGPEVLTRFQWNMEDVVLH